MLSRRAQGSVILWGILSAWGLCVGGALLRSRALTTVGGLLIVSLYLAALLAQSNRPQPPPR